MSLLGASICGTPSDTGPLEGDSVSGYRERIQKLIQIGARQNQREGRYKPAPGHGVKIGLAA